MFPLSEKLSFLESEISMTSTHSKHQLDSLLQLFDFSDVALVSDDIYKIDKEEETLRVREDQDISDKFNQVEQIAADEEELQDLNSESLTKFRSDWGNFGERSRAERPVWNNGNTTDTAFKVGLNVEELDMEKFDKIIEPLKGSRSKKHSKFKCLKKTFSSSCNSTSHAVASRFYCDICDKIYISSAWLKRHKKIKHDRPIGQNKKRKFIAKPFTSHLQFLERRVKARIEKESNNPSETQPILDNKGETMKAPSEPQLIATHAQERVRVQYPDWLMTYAV